MGKFKEGFILLFFLMISFNSFSQFPYYKPEPYFPIYPGSQWRYITSIGDTTISKSYDQYKLIETNGGDYPTDSSQYVFVPYFNNIAYNGYKTVGGGIVGPLYWNNYLFSDILNEEIYVDNDTRHCNTQICNFRKVVVIDTSIIIFAKTYDSIVIIKCFERAGDMNMSGRLAKKSGTYEYYAKNIGLIKLTSFDSTGAEKMEKELFDYKVVKKKFQIIQFNIPDTLEVYKYYSQFRSAYLFK